MRALDGAGATLWAQAPVLELSLVSSSERSGWQLAVENCMPGAELTVSVDGGAAEVVATEPGDRPTLCRASLDLPAGAELAARLAPPDAGVVEPYRVAVMGDIQTAMDDVHEVFARINETPGVRFVLSTGDVVENAQPGEYELFLDKVQGLEVPFFSTIGNHELTTEPERWHRLFGRYSIHFTFKGATMSFVDSGNASLDPILYERLDAWMQEAGSVHLFGTHFPAFDPVGVRSASFRSRKEAAKLLTRLAAGGVDATFYGHIHSYYAFENAGMPAYISGGGGAFPERGDGVGRHFLTVDLDPVAGEVAQVGLVRVDP